MQESNGIRAEYDYVSALLRVSGYKMPAAAAAIWHGDLREYAYLMTRELYSLSDWAEKYFDLHWFARDLVASGDVVELTNFADVGANDAVWLTNPAAEAAGTWERAA